MKIKPSKGNKTFCMAPWTHTYLSPQSERRLCCASREKASWTNQYIDSEKADKNSQYTPVSLEEHWNSPYMMDIRKSLLAGEEIPQCQVCNHKLLNIYTYRDYFTKNLFVNKIDEVFEKTNDDGYTEMKPISFDYRISNLCNFKCRMCGDQLSSSWEAENRMLGYYDNGAEAWATKEFKPIIEKFQKEVAEKELWDAVKNGTIEEIYWVGGEPLMFEIHWDIMKYLVQSGHSKNVTVRYNTNLSRTSFKGINLYDLLPHFKNVNISASIDGTDKIVEYVRHGIKWEKWLDNFKKGLFLNELYGDDGMVLDVTITSPGLFSMKDLFDLALELNVKSYIKKTFAFDSSIIMSPSMIPRDILNQIIDDNINYMKLKVTPKTKIYIESLEDLKITNTFEEIYDNYLEGIGEGKKRMILIDRLRNNEGVLENIFSKNTDLINWWVNI
jgi:organic radical activating enzyme